MFFSMLLAICGWGNLLFGITKSLGYHFKPPFRRPLLSVNLPDLFDRLFVHFKDYLLTIFFMPAMALTAKLGKYFGTLLSIVITLSLGVTLYSFLTFGLAPCYLLHNKIHGVSNIIDKYPGYDAQAYFRHLGKIFMGSVFLGMLIWAHVFFKEENYERVKWLRNSLIFIPLKCFQYLLMVFLLYYVWGF
jgi:hypothetical protein